MSFSPLDTPAAAGSGKLSLYTSGPYGVGGFRSTCADDGAVKDRTAKPNAMDQLRRASALSIAE
jgi:hypothetical protein